MSFENKLGLDRPCPRYWYLASCVVIDAFLSSEVHARSWVFAGVLVILLMYMTARRFVETGWSRRWAVPYALFTLGPCAVLFFGSRMDVRLIALGMAVLQVPAMAWPGKKRIIASGNPVGTGAS
jgi:hypothetical protein